MSSMFLLPRWYNKWVHPWLQSRLSSQNNIDDRTILVSNYNNKYCIFTKNSLNSLNEHGTIKGYLALYFISKAGLFFILGNLNFMVNKNN